MFRVVVAGAGPWGRILIKNILGAPDYELAGVVSRNSETPKLVPTSTQVAGDLKTITVPYDGLVVATPPEVHADLLRQGLAKRVPVFVEKPLALSLNETEQIHAVISAANAAVMVDHIHLFNPAYEQLRSKALDEGVCSIESVGGGPGPFRSYSALWDYGPHDLAVCFDLMGSPPLAVSAVQAHRANGGLSVQAGVHFSHDRTARVRFGNNFERKIRTTKVLTRKGNTYLFDDIANKTQNAMVATPLQNSVVPTPLQNALAIFRDDHILREDRRWGTGHALEIARALDGIERQLPN